MLATQTLDKLRDLNLMGMGRAYQEQMERADYQALPFDDRLGMLVDVELQERKNRRLFRPQGRQAARSGLHRGHRLPHAARSQPCPHPGAR